VIARTTVVVEPGGVLGRLSAQPPLTVRRIHADRPDTCALCLVGTAAGPLAGDDLALDLHVQTGSRVSLVAAGASIAQGSGSTNPARLDLRIRVDDGAHLDADPGALVVCAGSRVDVAVSIALAPTATVTWRELIVLGRTDAPSGAATLRWDVTRAGHPVLRQLVELTDPALTGWPGLVAGRRVLATALVAGPNVEAKLRVASPTAIAQPLDEHAVLVTVLADDAATAQAQVETLLTR
jgi:urease accessory protein